MKKPVARRFERVRVPEGTLGDVFRKRRWELGLEQAEAAQKIGVSFTTYQAWEMNRCEPALRYVLQTISFLGCDWRSPKPATTFGKRIRDARRRAGLSVEKLATRLRVHPSTLRRWEYDEDEPSQSYRVRVDAWLERHARDE